MDSNTGVLHLARSLVHSDISEYLLLVRAMDHAAQPKAASVPVRIQVTSSPDVPPSWAGTPMPKVEYISYHESKIYYVYICKNFIIFPKTYDIQFF